MNSMEETALKPTASAAESQEELEEAAAHQAPPAESVDLSGRDGQAEPPLRVIEPPKGITGIDWKELWRYRELLYFLTWRDVKVRYKQTVLGAAWAILQPFTQMVVFTIFFGKLAGIGHKTGGTPYPIYVYAGLLPWTFFANSVTNCANALVGNTNLITKVYFPRLVVPFATVGAALVDWAVSFAVLIGLMLWYGTHLTWQIACVPLFLAGTIMAAAGVGSMLSALTVAYRDFRYVVPFLIQIWLFVTPVIYPSKMVPGRWRWLLDLNPMSGLIEGFRAAFLGGRLDWPHIGLSFIVSAALFLAGAVYFRSTERRFADII